ARIETGTLPVDPEPAEVATLVDRARNVFASSGGRNHLAMELEPDLPLVLADRQRIVQVIGNLLSNAARHSPGDSVIRVSAVREAGHVEVSVADRGRGIPAEDLPHLFRRFSGTEMDGSGSGGNTGLGLAICKGIVEAHGGRIRAESDGPGLGARFAFTLPVVPETEPARRAARSPGDGQCAGTVLVVDDDPLALRSVRDALSTAGFRPVVTADPEEALALMAEHCPRLALLDLMLPERDGEELMGDLFAVSRIPVIFLSAYGRDEVVARLLEQGAADYIAKPFSPTELVARVRAALRRVGEPEFPAPAEPFALGDLTIDYAARSVTVSGRPAALTPIEFDLLAALAREAGRVVPHDRLLRRVWSPGKPGSLRALRTHLKHLRRKLGDDAANPTYIFAEPRVGYRMEKPDAPEGGQRTG
ncbi:MAG: response regulator, partial [Chloroflexi bacterium]|nr:response regulator [Chloroflexota bacterium]